MILIVAIFIIGCTSGTGDEGSEQSLPTTQTRERLIPENIDFDAIEITDPFVLEFGSFSFGIEPLNYEEMDPTMFFDGIFRLTDANNTLLARGENGSSEDMVVILKLFVNYEEVAFYVEGIAEADTEFVFLVPALHEVTIPLQLAIDLPEGDYSHKLTAAFFQSPHLNVSEDEGLRFYGIQMAMNYDFVYGEGGDIILTVPHQEASAQIELPVFLAVSDFIDGVDQEMLYTPFPSPLQVRRGELAELAFLGNPTARVPDVDDYVLIMMLDWHQIHPNRQPYLLFTANDSGGRLADYDTFTFLAPEETGLFEFVAIMIPNPTQESFVDIFAPLEMHRFTIEVVD